MLLVSTFPADPWAAPVARRIVGMTTPDLLRDAADDAGLLATERVTNSVLYGAGPVELRVRFQPGKPLRIEVFDRAGGFEPELPTSPPAGGETSGWTMGHRSARGPVGRRSSRRDLGRVRHLAKVEA